MPWFNCLSFSDFIKKRVCKFLINRYLGQFFDEKLTADQICLDLYNGKGSVYNVNLCCEVSSWRNGWKYWNSLRKLLSTNNEQANNRWLFCTYTNLFVVIIFFRSKLVFLFAISYVRLFSYQSSVWLLAV